MIGRWTCAIGPATGSAPTRELTEASGRRLTVRVDAAADAQFSTAGDSDELAHVIRLGWDLWVYYDQTHVFRGRIVGDQGSITATDHRVQFSAIDYRGMLNRRQIGAGGAHYPPGTDQAAIAWDLIVITQALAAGGWGITNGLGSSSGTLREANWDPGKPLGDAIAELGRLDNGFEWEIAPDLKLNRWYPKRGNATGLVLDLGGVLSRVDYGFTGDDFGNAGLVTGNLGTTPVAFESPTISADPRGRWERSQAFPTVELQDTLIDKAQWMRDAISHVRPDYRVTFAEGRWPGPAGAWIGDTVSPEIKNGWTQKFGTDHRIVELQMVPGDAGGTTVTAGLLAIGQDLDDLTGWVGKKIKPNVSPLPDDHPADVEPFAWVDEAGTPFAFESGQDIVWA